MNAIILFTRVPIAGHTKTRLHGFLTPEECAHLHRHMLKDAFNQLEQIEGVDLWVYVTPYESRSEMQDLLPMTAYIAEQVGQDIGEKMYRAIGDVLRRGYAKVLLMGADVPEVTTEDLQLALRQLDDTDVTIAPTIDGGYYLIGIKDLQVNPFVIDGEWGGNNVFEATLHHLSEKQKIVATLPVRQDLDTPFDLLQWMKKADIRHTHTYRYLKDIQIQNRGRM